MKFLGLPLLLVLLKLTSSFRQNRNIFRKISFQCTIIKPLFAKAREVELESSSSHATQKQNSLNDVLRHIERSYGSGVVQTLGNSTNVNVPTTPSGSITLDIALGGGYPKGRVIEIFGPESSGKTTLALHAIAEIQKLGGVAAFIDAEHALDAAYAKNLGVNLTNLLLCQPDCAEMALDIVDHLARSGAVDMIVVDSVAALVPRVELEGDMSDSQMGLQARLMSKALRKITGSLSKYQATVIFLNQLRSKIGVMFGNPEVTAGGNALKFYSSVRLDIRKREVLKDNEGIGVKVKVVKNKVAPPFRVVEFDILFGSGVDKYSCLLDAAELCGVIERKGAWYYYHQTRLAQGRKAVTELLGNNMELSSEITTQITKLKPAPHNQQALDTDQKLNLSAEIDE